MNTQTFAQVEDFTAITDEELMAVNGGNLRAITDKAIEVGLTTKIAPDRIRHDTRRNLDRIRD